MKVTLQLINTKRGSLKGRRGLELGINTLLRLARSETRHRRLNYGRIWQAHFSGQGIFDFARRLAQHGAGDRGGIGVVGLFLRQLELETFGQRR